MNDDIWRHRTAMMRCGFCMFFVEKVAPLGRCRKNAPELGGWPVVFVADWCGQHKLDEQKYAAFQQQQQRAMEAQRAQRNEGSQTLRKAESAGQVHSIGSADRASGDGPQPGDGKAA